MNIDILQNQLNKIIWSNYSHPCSPNTTFEDLPNKFIDLFSMDKKTSIKAVNQLWNDLAHQGNVGSISIPSCPFLIERIKTNPHIEVFIDIMEILYYFSCALQPLNKIIWNTEQEKKSYDYQWTLGLRKIFYSNLEIFKKLKHHSNEDVVDYAEKIIENIDFQHK